MGCLFVLKRLYGLRFILCRGQEVYMRKWTKGNKTYLISDLLHMPQCCSLYGDVTVRGTARRPRSYAWAHKHSWGIFVLIFLGINLSRCIGFWQRCIGFWQWRRWLGFWRRDLGVIVFWWRFNDFSFWNWDCSDKSLLSLSTSVNKQGRIHGYPSRMRVGRSSAGEGH